MKYLRRPEDYIRKIDVRANSVNVLVYTNKEFEIIWAAQIVSLHRMLYYHTWLIYRRYYTIADGFILSYRKWERRVSARGRGGAARAQWRRAQWKTRCPALSIAEALGTARNSRGTSCRTPKSQTAFLQNSAPLGTRLCRTVWGMKQIHM